MRLIRQRNGAAIGRNDRLTFSQCDEHGCTSVHILVTVRLPRRDSHHRFTSTASITTRPRVYYHFCVVSCPFRISFPRSTPLPCFSTCLPMLSLIYCPPTAPQGQYPTTTMIRTISANGCHCVRSYHHIFFRAIPDVPTQRLLNQNRYLSL